MPVGFLSAAAPSLIDYQRLLFLSSPPILTDAQGLIQGSDGRLYGTRHSRASFEGVLFCVETNGSNYLVLRHSTTNRASGIIEGRDGRLYGTESGDIRTNVSTVFAMDRDGSNYTVLRRFTAGQPQFGLVQNSNGWLYGTTTGDGAYNAGTIFRIATNGTGFQVLHEFAGGTDGEGPGRLVLGPDGMFYGCTFFGGQPDNVGTVFRIQSDGSDYSVLHRFTGGSQGRFPAARYPLLVTPDGMIFGGASGGSHQSGILYRLHTVGTGYQVIHHFAGGPEGGDGPYSGLVEYRDGALYGTTVEGGIDGAGTIFRINKNGSGFAVLRSYIDVPNPGDEDGSPTIPLLHAADGRLYGLTSGGDAEGTLFRFTPRPALRWHWSGSGLALSWLQLPGEYELQQNHGATTNGWTAVEAPTEITNGTVRITVPASSERRFFRLQKLAD